MSKPAKFVMNRDFTISGFGHNIGFKKDVPMQVPPMLHAEAMRCGATPLNPDDDVAHVEIDKTKAKQAQGEERSKIVIATMDKLVEQNKRMSFGADGLPTLKAIFYECGIDLQKNERDHIWKQRVLVLNADANPSNATITEIQTAKISNDRIDAENKEVDKEAEVVVEKTAPPKKKAAIRRSK